MAHDSKDIMEIMPPTSMIDTNTLSLSQTANQTVLPHYQGRLIQRARLARAQGLQAFGGTQTWILTI